MLLVIPETDEADVQCFQAFLSVNCDTAPQVD